MSLLTFQRQLVISKTHIRTLPPKSVQNSQTIFSKITFHDQERKVKIFFHICDQNRSFYFFFFKRNTSGITFRDQARNAIVPPWSPKDSFFQHAWRCLQWLMVHIMTAFSVLVNLTCVHLT